MSRRLTWLMLLALLFGVEPVAAQEPTNSDEPAVADQGDGNKAAARKLFHDAGVAMGDGRYATAATLYGRSNELFPAPTAALGEARALVKVGRLLEAFKRYDVLVKTALAPGASAAFQQAVEDAGKERELVRARLASLTIAVEGQGEVFLDGEALSATELGKVRLIDPGEHKLTARGVKRVVTLGEGQALEVLIAIPSQESEQPGPQPIAADSGDGEAQRTAGFVMIGLGGVGLVVAAITGGIYVDAKSTVDEECDDQQMCSPNGLNAVDRARAVGTVNVIALISGVALGALGITLALTAEDGSTTGILPTWSPTHGGLSFAGTF